MEVETQIPLTSVVQTLSPVQTKTRTQKDSPNSATKNLIKTQEELDPKCVLQIEKRLVRVEYPGEVRNVDRAIETLGGMDKLESSVAQHGRKLELHFHPRSKYNKPCFADKDFKPGILIKVKGEPDKYDYDIEGVSVVNFTFNRLCDFQYLPLVAPQPETKNSRAVNIHDRILPAQLPDLDWLESEDAKNMDQFLPPVSFSHHDSAHSKLNVESDKNEPGLKLKGAVKLNPKQQKSVCRIFKKTKHQTSVFVGFQDKEIPTKPLEHAVKLLKHRNLENVVQRVKRLFEERPIWTKAAIRHITGLTDEHSKIVLPVVAYYFTNGPWRITWVKFGYDPRSDPTARIYQTLDYRIRTAEGTKLKVSAKRSYAGKTSVFLDPGRVKKVSLKQDMSARPKIELDERYYVLRPSVIPPARQMFYQFCDILLPEIQDRISRLPERCSYCHPKSGFLPDDFLDYSRKVVNDYVLEAVQKELLEDKKVLEKKASKEKEERKEPATPPLDYYNRMLRKIKKGLYQNMDLGPGQSSSREPVDEQDIELISLSSDDDDDAFGELIQSSIPEKIEGEEEEHSEVSAESSDEAEIDLEAVQEINELLSQMGDKS